MAGKYEIHPMEKKFILDTTGVDLDAPSKLSHAEFMRIKNGDPMNLSEPERPSAGEAYVRAAEVVHRISRTLPVTFAYPADDSPSMPVSALQVSFEGKPDESMMARRSVELRARFGRGKRLIDR